MLNEKDIYTHLKNGGDPQELYDAFLKEMNAAQKKVDDEAEAAEAAAIKEGAKAQAREAAIAALSDYFTLVMPEPVVKSVDNLPALVEEALDSLEETIKLMESVTIRVNGKPFSIFDL